MQHQRLCENGTGTATRFPASALLCYSSLEPQEIRELKRPDLPVSPAVAEAVDVPVSPSPTKVTAMDMPLAVRHNAYREDVARIEDGEGLVLSDKFAEGAVKQHLDPAGDGKADDADVLHPAGPIADAEKAVASAATGSSPSERRIQKPKSGPAGLSLAGSVSRKPGAAHLVHDASPRGFAIQSTPRAAAIAAVQPAAAKDQPRRSAEQPRPTDHEHLSESRILFGATKGPKEPAGAAKAGSPRAANRSGSDRADNAATPRSAAAAVLREKGLGVRPARPSPRTSHLPIASPRVPSDTEQVVAATPISTALSQIDRAYAVPVPVVGGHVWSLPSDMSKSRKKRK